MAVSHEQWGPAAELTQAYYPGVDMGPVYGPAYSLPATSEYGAQQRSVFGEPISQTYVRPRPLVLCLTVRLWRTDDLPPSLCRSAREQIPA